MLNKAIAENGAGGKGSAPTPTPTPIIVKNDMAGMAIEMQSLLPEPHLLPLYYLNLKLSHDELKLNFEMLLNRLKEIGLDNDG